MHLKSDEYRSAEHTFSPYQLRVYLSLLLSLYVVHLREEQAHYPENLRLAIFQSKMTQAYIPTHRYKTGG